LGLAGLKGAPSCGKASSGMLSSSIDPSEVLAELRRILSARMFQGASRLQEFLHFVVVETVAGRGHQLKEHTIGVAVYRRSLDYDPKLDSIVRVEALKLRKKIDGFYEHDGGRAEIRISLSKGTYAPSFSRQYDPAARHEVEELIAKGTYLLHKVDEESMSQAVLLFQRALAAEPRNLHALNALIHVRLLRAGAEYESPSSNAAEVVRLAATAQALDARNSDTQVSEMLASGFCRQDLNGAIQAGRRALELDPNNGNAHFWAAGVLCGLGRHEEAERHTRRAIRLQPSRFSWHVSLGRGLYWAGEFERARELLVDLQAWESGFWPLPWILGHVYAALGRFDDAVAEMERAHQVSRGASMALASLGWAYALAGLHEKAEKALCDLEKASAHQYVGSTGVAAIQAVLGRPAEAATHARAAVLAGEYFLSFAPFDQRIGPVAKLAV